MTQAKDGDSQAVRVESSQESPVRHRLTVEVDARRVKRAFDRAYQGLARTAQVRGFRKGKVPRSMLEKMYGASMGEELERTLVSESLPEALAQVELQPVSEPSIEARPPVDGEPFTFVAEVEIKPVVELQETRGLAARRPEVQVDETEVQQRLEDLRQRQAPVVEEPPETTIRNGHLTTVDFEGSIDGEPFEGGAGKEVQLEIGEGRMIPGFEEQLLGSKAGDAVRIEVAFPEDYGNAELAGKQAVFDTRVRDVRRRDLAELDDEFAKDLGDFETLAELRERIKGEMVETAEREADGVLRDSLLDALCKANPVEVPPGLVERTLEARLRSAHQRLENQVPEDALHQQLSRWREEWREAAEREVRVSLLLEAVADAESIQVDDAELDARLEELAVKHGQDPRQTAKLYREAGMLESLREELRAEQAYERLRAEAEIETISGT